MRAQWIFYQNRPGVKDFVGWGVFCVWRSLAYHTVLYFVFLRRSARSHVAVLSEKMCIEPTLNGCPKSPWFGSKRLVSQLGDKEPWTVMIALPFSVESKWLKRCACMQLGCIPLLAGTTIFSFSDRVGPSLSILHIHSFYCNLWHGDNDQWALLLWLSWTMMMRMMVTMVVKTH